MLSSGFFFEYFGAYCSKTTEWECKWNGLKPMPTMVFMFLFYMNIATKSQSHAKKNENTSEQ